MYQDPDKLLKKVNNIDTSKFKTKHVLLWYGTYGTFFLLTLTKNLGFRSLFFEIILKHAKDLSSSGEILPPQKGVAGMCFWRSNQYKMDLLRIQSKCVLNLPFPALSPLPNRNALEQQQPFMARNLFWPLVAAWNQVKYPENSFVCG